jgi:hypothetical protein
MSLGEEEEKKKINFENNVENECESPITTEPLARLLL